VPINEPADISRDLFLHGQRHVSKDVAKFFGRDALDSST
jgi:hypothetical protein